jgi:mycothiol synthase
VKSDERQRIGHGASLVIRSYGTADARALVKIHNAGFPDDPYSLFQFRRWLYRVLAAGGRAWVLSVDGATAGYASVAPVSGLEGIFELYGCIAPSWQRQGLGTKLWSHLLADLGQSDVRQVAHPVASLDSPAASFLLGLDFFIEHEELRLDLADMSHLPSAGLPPGFHLKTYSQSLAIRHFRRLYDACFSGLPWYQPYVSDQEAAAEMVDAGDLLFLLDGRTPVGFLWMRWLELSVGEIEPVGLLPQYRGRGLGRILFLSGLRRLADQGAEKVTLGVWDNNHDAIHLYESLGFRHVDRLIYLAYNVGKDIERDA